jgi:hypothetical protein
VRTLSWVLVLCAGCHASATVENTMPVANLQSYKAIAVRVHSSAFAAQGQAMRLEAAVLDRLRQKCGFEQVFKADQGGAADILIDLNLAQSARGGGGGWVSSSSTASIETLVVLTDAHDGELLGTARIRGKSSGMIINNAPPENEAIDVVAKTVGELLAKSGCSGPRIARVEPVVDPGPGSGDPGPGSGSAAPIDESKRPEADALNDKGKEKLYSDDIPGALALFQQAMSLLPDARYQYNICLAYIGQEHYDDATAACRQARAMNPQPGIATKIDHTMQTLAQRK